MHTCKLGAENRQRNMMHTGRPFLSLGIETEPSVVFPQSTPRPLPLPPQASTGPAIIPSLPATLASVSSCPMSVMALTTAAIIPMKNIVVGFLSVYECTVHFTNSPALEDHSTVQEEGHLTNCPVCEGHLTL